MLAFGSLSGRPVWYSPREVLTRTLRIEGFWLAKWLDGATHLRLVRKVSRLMQAGILVNNDVGRAFSLDDITDAVTESEIAGRGGKAWLRIGDE